MSIDHRLSVIEADASGMDRRGFLGRCAGCALASGCVASAGVASAWGKPTMMEPRPKVRLVFSHIPPGQPTWPYNSYDYEARKRELTRKLVQGCPQIEFLPATVHDADATRRLLAEDKDKKITGYLVYMVGIWTGAPQTIAEAGKPTLFVDDLYAGSGEFLIAFAAARRAGKNVAGVSSSRFDDVLTAGAVSPGSRIRKTQASSLLCAWPPCARPTSRWVMKPLRQSTRHRRSMQPWRSRSFANRRSCL